MGMGNKIAFLCAPVVNIGLVVWKMIDGTVKYPFQSDHDPKDVFASWFVTLALVNVMTLLLYWQLIRSLELMVCDQLADLDEEQEIKEPTEKEKQMVEYDFRGYRNEIDIYGRQIRSNFYRVPGTGPYRLGKNISVRCDLYSMLFVTCMRPEYVWHFKNEAEIAEIAIKEYV